MRATIPTNPDSVPKLFILLIKLGVFRVPYRPRHAIELLEGYKEMFNTKIERINI